MNVVMKFVLNVCAPHDNGHYEQEFKTDQVFLHLHHTRQ